MNIIRLVVLTTLVLAGSAAAQASLLKTTFTRWDKNKDGKVLRTEYPGSDEQFASMDKNKDKKVTFKEFEASPAAKRILAYRERRDKEARDRTTPEQLASGRLAAISRFDKNKDGKVTKKEWNGAPQAFDSLDLDKNGVIDKRDRAIAKKSAALTDYAIIKQFKTYVPKDMELLKRFDKDKDGQLTRAELAKTKLLKAFALGDRNGDKKLDKNELRALVGAINGYVYGRNTGSSKPRAYVVPFASWDKNKDGRIDIKEWPDSKKYLFARIDINRDAGITKEEVERYKRSVEGDNFIEKHDLNGDNRVTFEEFGGSKAAFLRADRNKDGVISAADR